MALSMYSVATAQVFVWIFIQAFIKTSTSALNLGTEYIGIEAPLFTVEDRGTASCYQYFLALAVANCTTHQSEILPVQVHNCEGSGASGILVLERTTSSNLSPSDPSGTATYRLRVAGPDGLWLLEPIYCRPDFAIARYDLRHPGIFSIEVLMLYTSFSFIQPNNSQAVQAPWASYLTLDVQLTEPWMEASQRTPEQLTMEMSDSSGASSKLQQPQPIHIAHQRWSRLPDETIITSNGAPSDTRSSSSHRSRHPHSDNDSEMPLCLDAGPLPGRWQFQQWPPAASDATAAAAAALLRTCIWYATADPDADCGAPERRPLRFNSHPAGLSWRPSGCRLRAFTGIPSPPPLPPISPAEVAAAPPPPPPPSSQPISPANCLPHGRRICFVGDSHMRYLLNTLVMWQHEFQVSVNNTIKELLTSNSVHYEYMRWGDDWTSDSTAAANALLAAKCTDVVANFGQWPASYRAGPAPYSAVQYLRALLRVRRALLLAVSSAASSSSPRHLRVFWVTTCMSSLKARLEVAGADWRTDPLLTLYNRMALDVMSGELPAALTRTLAPNPTLAHNHPRTMGSLRLGDNESEGRRELSEGEGQQEEEAEGRLQKAEGGKGHQDDRISREVSRVAQMQSHRGPGEIKPSVLSLHPSHRRRRTHTSLGNRQAQKQAQEQQRKALLGTRGSTAARSAWGTGNVKSREENSVRTGGRFTSVLLAWLKKVLPSGPRHRRRLLTLLQEEVDAELDGMADVAVAWDSQAVAARAEAAIPVIDTWSATRILHDTTWDGVHFSNTGAVGLVQLTVLLHVLCAEGMMAEVEVAERAPADGTGSA